MCVSGDTSICLEELVSATYIRTSLILTPNLVHPLMFITLISGFVVSLKFTTVLSMSS